ncbi:neurogenic locus notch homolog protein 1-like [Ischnura elegans]|uniref:neurogenic locus notch homolog protein 1-like n=1 Tax=Ischnura elegans TaxID=197161 RepID=UPI001ED887EA|nr:neurogenic locus notch homolog protein 1-like [Ischnura elegans]
MGHKFKGANCVVSNHVPICSCPPGISGDPFIICRPFQEPVVTQPCNPSPCGPNSQCRVLNNVAVCSCLPEYVGSPPSCRPECVVNSECNLNQACSNQKCRDPCPGTCGTGARCEVVNHNPICSCPSHMTGDPFVRCYPPAPVEAPPINPCQPSPCGPYAECRVIGDSPSCSCLPEYRGSPPNCRPECVSNSECPSHLACINQKCKDPCPGTCGAGAECRVISHTPNCFCPAGFFGDPFVHCRPQPVEPVGRPFEQMNPCVPSPCGANAICREQNKAGSCTCLPDYLGNPYEGCRPECTLNSDCPSSLACIRNKCKDPCPGTCGQRAECRVINHLSSCTCLPGHTGDPFRYCSIIPPEPVVSQPLTPCTPSPCGPNSVCKEVNEQAVCSCLPEYIGSPPGCRPECVVSSECPQNRACVNRKCVDPCPGACGQFTRCKVINHSPICSCRKGHTGDPFSRCYPIPSSEPVKVPVPVNPCVPSPCGPNAVCQAVGDFPSCSCNYGYLGSPPNCRPECVISSECSANLACIREKCRDPCPGSCGQGAECSVINHTPVCTCPRGYTGDPFTFCYPERPKQEPVLVDPCNPSPCGPNAKCLDGVCTCIEDFRGDPYAGCRPECVLNDDCPRDKACIRSHCSDPCPGTCGQGARCDVINHIPFCSCPNGLSGNAFVACHPVPAPVKTNPCNPSPCGPNSQCREINGQAVCSCVVGYIGSPPTCRPECVVNSDCALNEACSNQKCIDPCRGTCGIEAKCQVINHSPICSCPARYTGNPFTRCYIIVEQPVVTPSNPCQPAPCGPYAECKVFGEGPSCSCLPDYFGSPPNCRPECVSNGECASHLACINQKCRDPCPGMCGTNAECTVVSHTPNCVCLPGYTGDPFSQCIAPQVPEARPLERPCSPSPCGVNAVCREQNNAGSCTCLPDHIGNPYEGCRPECVINTDCPSHLACLQGKCKDPCPGTCGQNAACQVINHLPLCYCHPGHTGDPFRYCNVIPEAGGDGWRSSPLAAQSGPRARVLVRRGQEAGRPKPRGRLAAGQEEEERAWTLRLEQGTAGRRQPQTRGPTPWSGRKILGRGRHAVHDPPIRQRPRLRTRELERRGHGGEERRAAVSGAETVGDPRRGRRARVRQRTRFVPLPRLPRPDIPPARDGLRRLHRRAQGAVQEGQERHVERKDPAGRQAASPATFSHWRKAHRRRFPGVSGK